MMSRRSLVWMCLLLGGIAPGLAMGSSDTVLRSVMSGQEFKTLILEAMKSPNAGRSSVVYGDVAAMIRKSIKAPNAQVIANVSVIGDIPPEGCKRVRIQFTTPGTLLPMSDGSKRMLDISMMINMCPDGQPPGANEVGS